MSKVSVNGIELAYDDVGNGPAVLFLHGFPFNRSMWREQLALLSPAARVIAPDLRGHGETASSTISQEPVTMETMAADVVALMDALDISQATVCGLSMGGYVALALCRLFPARVSTLVLADTRAVADTEAGKQIREQQAQKALQEGMAAIADAMLPKLVAPVTVAKHPEVVARIREMILRTDPAGAAAAQRAMAQRLDHSEFLPQIKVPTLIICGELDQLTPLSESQMMHKLIAGSRLEIIEAAGHVSNLEQPEAFNRALTTFFGFGR
jgi:3-oxoadipate enol-lactonase